MGRLIASFTVEGPVVPKGRPRMGKGHAFTPKRTKEYETLVTVRASESYGHKKPSDARLRVTVVMVFVDKRRRDIDNCAKSILDALNGVVYQDDSQIDVLILRRRRGHHEDFAMVDVEEIDE